MKGHILLVEDDVSIGSLLFDLIKGAGYKVHWAKNGTEGLQMFSKHSFTCILLDIMMPEKNGFEVLDAVRKINQQIPVIILTAKSEILDKKQAFDLGADDYVVKPFEWEELELRLASKHRNSVPQENYNIGSLQFDPSKQQLLPKQGEVQSLSGRESQVLHILCQHKNKAVQREDVLNLVWGIDSYQNSRNLDVVISRLRSNLKTDPKVKIENIHGKGFELKD